MQTVVFTIPGKPEESINGVTSILNASNGKVDVISKESGHHTLEWAWIRKIE